MKPLIAILAAKIRKSSGTIGDLTGVSRSLEVDTSSTLHSFGKPVLFLVFVLSFLLQRVTSLLMTFLSKFLQTLQVNWSCFERKWQILQVCGWIWIYRQLLLSFNIS